MTQKKAVLYLSYTGMLEPLGRSQVLSYLFKLSEKYRFTVISFEKKEDLENYNLVEQLKDECKSYGITWLPQKYHKSPRLLATLWDMWLMFYISLKQHKHSSFSLIHGRSYVASAIAFMLNKALKVPFLFDMRALWIEELLEAKSIQRGSFLTKTLYLLERRLLNNANHIISLTKVAIPFLQKKYPELNESSFTVIPTCVDLDKFTPNKENCGPLRCIGTAGTVDSGRYKLDQMLLLFKGIKEKDENLTFKIISRDSIEVVKNRSEFLGFDFTCVEMYSADSSNILFELAHLDFAFVLFTPGVSTLGTSPTRIGEFLAMGIPVVVNSGVGDTADIISEHNVGIVIDNNMSSLELLSKMRVLKADSLLSTRCHSVAADIFSVNAGAMKYHKAYLKCVS